MPGAVPPASSSTSKRAPGAISGAFLGRAAIPGHLVARLENGPRGRDYIVALAERLFALAEGE